MTACSKDSIVTSKNTQPAFDSNLARLVRICSELARARPGPVDADQRQAALNVQIVLAELGRDVSLEVAAEVWRHRSNSVLAGWLTGAETIASAKEALYSYIQHAPQGGFTPDPPGPAGYD